MRSGGIKRTVLLTVVAVIAAALPSAAFVAATVAPAAATTPPPLPPCTLATPCPTAIGATPAGAGKIEAPGDGTTSDLPAGGNRCSFARSSLTWHLHWVLRDTAATARRRGSADILFDDSTFRTRNLFLTQGTYTLSVSWHDAYPLLGERYRFSALAAPAPEVMPLTVATAGNFVQVFNGQRGAVQDSKAGNLDGPMAQDVYTLGPVSGWFYMQSFTGCTCARLIRDDSHKINIDVANGSPFYLPAGGNYSLTIYGGYPAQHLLNSFGTYSFNLWTARSMTTPVALALGAPGVSAISALPKERTATASRRAARSTSRSRAVPTAVSHCSTRIMPVWWTAPATCPPTDTILNLATTGQYELDVTREALQAPTPPCRCDQRRRMRPLFTPHVVPKIAFGQTPSGNISTGADDVYTFDGTAGRPSTSMRFRALRPRRWNGC
jgi:hypothetical protein